MKKRLILLLGILLAIAGAMAAAGAEQRTVRISYNAMPLNLPSIVLRQRGFLDQELASLGWKAEWVVNLSTGPLLSEALAAGALDIAAVMGETSAVVARAAGNDIVIAAPYSVAPKAFALVVPVDGGARDLRGLLGKKIGLPLGTTAHYLLAKALAAEGLDLDGVEVLNMTVPDAAAAVSAGGLAGAVLVEPVLSRVAGTGKVRVLRDGGGLIGGLTVMAVRGGFLRQNQPVVAAYQRALARAGKSMAERPEEAIELAVQETKLPADLVRKIAAKYTFLEIPRAEMTRELAAVIAFLADRKMIARRPDLGDLVVDPLMPAGSLPPGPVLVSACLLGTACRYDGGHCLNEPVRRALAGREVLPVCPESLGGLPTPRPPAEIAGGAGGDVLAGLARVLDREGTDRTEAFRRGAEAVLAAAGKHGARAAVLKERSPSCGVRWIYDGSFRGRAVPGRGVTAALLAGAGLDIWSEEDVGTLFGDGRWRE